MALNYKDAYARLGRLSGLSQKYFDGSEVRKGYSTVASQQNPDPLYTYRYKSTKKGGGFQYGEPVSVYKADKPVAPPAPAPPAAAPPVRPPTPTTPTNNYQSQIAALTARIADQQKSAAAAAAAFQQADADRAAAAKASEAQYQSRLSDLSTSFDSRLLQQQQGFDSSLAGQKKNFNSLFAQQQQGFDTNLAQQAEAQSAYLNDLQIQQDTRLSKMALDAKTRADDLALGQRTYQQNQSRSNQLGDLQIGNAGGAPRIGGTQGFKRRKLQINPVTANALSGILGGTAATSSTNTLNV